MAGNTSTKKQYSGIKGAPVGATLPPKTASYGRASGGSYAGQVTSEGGKEKFGDPLNSSGVSPAIRGMEHTHNDIGEVSGFITNGYLDKKGTPYGEAAKFNFLPPGMDISGQEMVEIHDMPMKTVTGMSYPDDGWSPTPKDLEE